MGVGTVGGGHLAGASNIVDAALRGSDFFKGSAESIGGNVRGSLEGVEVVGNGGEGIEGGLVEEEGGA